MPTGREAEFQLRLGSYENPKNCLFCVSLHKKTGAMTELSEVLVGTDEHRKAASFRKDQSPASNWEDKSEDEG